MTTAIVFVLATVAFLYVFDRNAFYSFVLTVLMILLWVAVASAEIL